MDDLEFPAKLSFHSRIIGASEVSFTVFFSRTVNLWWRPQPQSPWEGWMGLDEPAGGASSNIH